MSTPTEQVADVLHESRCGPTNREHEPWTDDHREWDLATARAMILLGVSLVERPDWTPKRQLTLSGPVVIGQSDDDPGDMGEPRVFEADGVTYVVVPSFDYWKETR